MIFIVNIEASAKFYFFYYNSIAELLKKTEYNYLIVLSMGSGFNPASLKSCPTLSKFQTLTKFVISKLYLKNAT